MGLIFRDIVHPRLVNSSSRIESDSEKQSTHKFEDKLSKLNRDLPHGTNADSLPLMTNIDANGRRQSPYKNTFQLAITLTFHDEKGKGEFIDIFKPFAAWIAQHEFGTLSYELAQSDKDPLIVNILERYRTKADYLDVHKNSPQFLEFRAKMAAMAPNYVMNGHSYYETNIGFA